MPRADAIAVLRRRGYDPIEALIDTHEKVSKEIEVQEMMGVNGVLVRDDGTTRKYYADGHYNLLDKQIKIGETLLRYMYGRVPESEATGTEVAPLVVKLTHGD